MLTRMKMKQLKFSIPKVDDSRCCLLYAEINFPPIVLILPGKITYSDTSNNLTRRWDFSSPSAVPQAEINNWAQRSNRMPQRINVVVHASKISDGGG